MNNSLKENVKKLAKERGVSIRKLEQDIGIADKSISKWDKMMPSIDKVEKVAKYFAVPEKVTENRHFWGQKKPLLRE